MVCQSHVVAFLWPKKYVIHFRKYVQRLMSAEKAEMRTQNWSNKIIGQNKPFPPHLNRMKKGNLNRIL